MATMLGCNVDHGFNFRKEKQAVSGFILALKIGDVQLATDLTCKDVLSPTTDLKVVGVLSQIGWDWGVTDAVNVAAQVSATNRQSVALLMLKDLTKIDVLFKFVVFGYDPVVKKYYKCFHCNDTEMKGLIEKQNNSLALNMAEDPSTEVTTPLNYSLQLGIKPQPIKQDLHILTGDQKAVVKQWGLTEG